LTSSILLKFSQKKKQQQIELLAIQDVYSFLSFASDNLEKESKRMVVFQNMDKK